MWSCGTFKMCVYLDVPFCWTFKTLTTTLHSSPEKVGTKGNVCIWLEKLAIDLGNSPPKLFTPRRKTCRTVQLTKEKSRISSFDALQWCENRTFEIVDRTSKYLNVNSNISLKMVLSKIEIVISITHNVEWICYYPSLRSSILEDMYLGFFTTTF